MGISAFRNDLLKSYNRKCIAYDFKKHQDMLYDMFDEWDPEVVIDAKVVAESKGIESNFEGLSQDVTGGSFCSRASDCPSLTTPSRQALRHRGIRASLFYSFVLKHIDLDDRVRRQRDESEHRDWSRGRRRAHSGSERERCSGSDRELMSPDGRVPRKRYRR